MLTTRDRAYTRRCACVALLLTTHFVCVTCTHSGDIIGTNRMLTATASDDGVELKCELLLSELDHASLKVMLTNVSQDDIFVDREMMFLLDVHLYDKRSEPIRADVDSSASSAPASEASFVWLSPGKSLSRIIQFPGRERYGRTVKRYDSSFGESDFYCYATSVVMPNPASVGKLIIIYGNSQDQIRGLYGVLGRERAEMLSRRTLTVVIDAGAF